MDSKKTKQQKEEKRKKQKEKNSGKEKIMVTIIIHEGGVGGSGADTQETWDSHSCKTLHNTLVHPKD